MRKSAAGEPRGIVLVQMHWDTLRSQQKIATSHTGSSVRRPEEGSKRPVIGIRNGLVLAALCWALIIWAVISSIVE